MADLTYVALRKMKVGEGYRYPGDEVPEAGEWRNLSAYISRGAIAVVASGDEAVRRTATQVWRNEPGAGRPTPQQLQQVEDVEELEEVDVSQYHEGGGYYELPDGTRVRGKENARLALAGRADEVDEDDLVTEADSDEE